MTYYQGRTHPDDEPRHNRYREKARQSKFTEEVAAQVQDGDLYFSMSMPASGRYYVPVSPGEHGLENIEEGQLICVTHQFKKPYPDLPGKWEFYDSGGNIVIKVSETVYPESTVMEAIERALYRTPLGRVVGREPLRAMAESLLKAFGIEYYGDDKPSTYTLSTDADALAKSALLDLLTYAPENGYDDRLGAIGADADGVGFAEDAEQYALLINGETDGFGKKAHKRRRGKPLPLMSQPVFYAVLGWKDNGRSFQARISALMQAVGLTDDELHDYAHTNDGAK